MAGRAVQHTSVSESQPAVHVQSGAFSWESAPENILWDPTGSKKVQFGDRKHAKAMRRKAAELHEQRKKVYISSVSVSVSLCVC